MNDSIWAGTIGPVFYYCPYCQVFWNNKEDHELHMSKHENVGK